MAASGVARGAFLNPLPPPGGRSELIDRPGSLVSDLPHGGFHQEYTVHVVVPLQRAAW